MVASFRSKQDIQYDLSRCAEALKLGRISTDEFGEVVAAHVYDCEHQELLTEMLVYAWKMSDLGLEVFVDAIPAHCRAVCANFLLYGK